MSAKQNIEHYVSAVIKLGLYSSNGNLQFHLKTLFDGIHFEDRRVLDIGGGEGLHSFYAAYMGAKEVICLEPGAQGSSSDVSEKFRKLSESIGLHNVTLEPITLQAFESKDEKFDITLFHNSINHLNEAACINLLKDKKSRYIYQNIFSRISSLSNGGAKIIICDCSRYNFFALLRIRNPFVPMIEWHKHQAPEMWAYLLSEAGFINPKIRWTSFNSLRSLGKILTGNKLLSYFLTSHFCLTMEKP